MTVNDGLNIANLGLALAPTVVQAVEQLFGKKPKPTTPAEQTAQNSAKAQAGLNMAVAGITAALQVDPSAFGDPEKALITAVHNDVVAYFNAKGWPVT